MEYKLTKITPWGDRYYFEVKTFEMVDGKIKKLKQKELLLLKLVILGI